MDTVMKDVSELLAQLELLDIKLAVENGALRFNAPKGVMTQPLRDKIAAYKQSIIAFLSDRSYKTSVDDASNYAEERPIHVQPREEGLPLSSAQQRFWFLDQLDQGNSTAFNMPPMVIRLNGNLNVKALQDALNAIINRHEVLRSAFCMKNKKPVQIPVSTDNLNVDIPIYDIRDRDKNEQQSEIRKITLNEASTPFDLKTGGILLRVVLVQTKDFEHYFILTMHHIISDGWSIGLFVKEIGVLYRAFLNNGHALSGTTNNETCRDFHIKASENILPPLPIQYADYAYWERSRLNEPKMELQKQYWINQLKDAPTLLELPTDYQRPRIRQNHGRSEHFYLESDIADRLKEFCKTSGLTPYMALVASFGVLLCRYTGQEEIVIGSPISVRPHSQTEQLIGLFLNTIALRIDLSGNPSFSEIGKRVKKLTLDAYQNSELPFDMILQELNLERSLTHTPLFQVLFALQNAPIGQIELEGLTINPMPPGEELISPFDLVLSVEEKENSIAGKFRYNTDLFEAPTIIRMVEHYKNLLKSMLLNANQPIRYLPMISSQEFNQLKKWQGGALADGVQVGKNYFPVTETITQIFERQAAKNPDSIALTLTLNGKGNNWSKDDIDRNKNRCDNGKESDSRIVLTYQQLNERANRLAHKIISLSQTEIIKDDVSYDKDEISSVNGAGKSGSKANNVRIGLCMERSVELVVGILAILKAGGAYVPLDPAYPDERLRFIVKDAGIKIIVGLPELIQHLELESVTIINPLDVLDKDDNDTALSSNNYSSPVSTQDKIFLTNPPSQSSPESIAYVIYTSGSTGLPKGVLVTHANVVRLFTSTDQLFGFTDKDVWTLFHSFAFDFSVWELWGALLYGGRLVVVPYGVSRSPDAFYALLSSEGVTVLNQTPSAFRQLIEVDGRVGCNAGSHTYRKWEHKQHRIVGCNAGSHTLDNNRFADSKDNILSADSENMTHSNIEPLSLKWVIFGGEALEPRTLKSWVQRHGVDKPQLINMYGITETTVHVTFYPVTAADVEAGGSPIGRALPDLSVHLVDSFNQPVPIGVVGEMLVGGAGVSNGYLNRPELTDTRFIDSESVGIDAVDGKLYRSGDLARWLPNADGVLEYLGRMDMQVKIRGFRIELGEIEGCLVSHPKVREAVVEPRKSSAGAGASGDTISLVAYITIEEDDKAGLTGELRQYLAQKLPDYMVPASIVVMERLPLTTNGKIDRRALPEPDANRPDLKVELVLPRTALESMLADLWSEILGITTIGVDDNFFELGGDSIKGVIFTNKLQEKIESVVYVVALFEAPTIRELVAYLHQHYADAVKRLEGAETSDTKTGSDSDLTNQNTGQNRKISEEMVSILARAIKPIAPFSYRRQSINKKPNPQAVFVLAPPRSGTTLMRVLLGGHPKLFAPPELELLLFNTLDERKRVCSGRDSFWLEGTLRAVMEVLNIDGDAAKQLMAEREEQGISVKDFYGEMQSWLGDRILVDKSPSYSLDLAVLQRAEEYFENPLYIHLHRHPYGMIYSFEEANLHQIFFRHPHNFAPRQLAELIWVQSHRNITRFLAAVPPERQINIGFAQMTASPEETMKTICTFIGIDFDPQMLKLYEEKEQRKRMTDGIHAESKMLGDIKFHTHKRIEPSAAERWRSRYKEDFLGEPSWDMALSLGYTREFIGIDSRAASNGISRDFSVGIAENRENIKTPIILDRYKSDGSLPLSFAQQRLWFLDQLEGAGTAYNMPVAVSVKGALNTDALAAAFRAIAQRHEGLRSRFETVEGGPVVRISPKAPEMVTIDISEMPYEEKMRHVKDLLELDAVGKFDLGCGPLFRSTLLVLDKNDFIILVNMHHIVSDGWSMGVLVREWQELYNSFIKYKDTHTTPSSSVNSISSCSTLTPISIISPTPRTLPNGEGNKYSLPLGRAGEGQNNYLKSYISVPESVEFDLYSYNAKEILPQLTFHYVDYARRQRWWAAQGGLERDIDYWKKQLAGAPALLELPTDRQRPPIQSFNGKTVEFSISSELTQSLKSIADNAGASLYMVLLAAFGVLLMRYSGQKDVVIGSPSANRTTKEVEGLIGFFVNTLVMRLSVEPDLIFSELLAQVRETALEAYAHQEVPFEKLVEEIKPERNLSYSPIFQVMFSMQSDPAPVPQLEGVEVTIIEQPTNISKYDLTLSITEQSYSLNNSLNKIRTDQDRNQSSSCNGNDDKNKSDNRRTKYLSAALEFNTDLFNLDTMERLSGHFVRLLEGIVEDAGYNISSLADLHTLSPGSSSTEIEPQEMQSQLALSKLPLLTESEYNYLIYDLNNTFRPFPKAKTIHGLFEEQVFKTPDAVALQFGYKPSGEDHQYITYHQLNCRANEIAYALLEMGVTVETTVAIAIERSPDMVAGLLGILKAGAAYIPLDPAYPKDRIAYILDNAGVQVLLTQSPLLARLPEHNGKTFCIDMEQCGESDCTMPFDSCSELNLVNVDVKSDNLAYVIYTSGSTGNPKGVMIPHGAAVNFINSMAKEPGITANDRLLAVTTISFDIAVLELYMPLSVGARVVIATEEMTRDGEMLIEMTASQDITMMQATPATWRLMLASGWQGRQNLKILCGGEALPGTLAAQLLPKSASLWNLYGPTETTVWSTLYHVRDTTDAKAQPIGRPIDNTTLYILDETMNPVPIGVAGELYIGGSGLARGYWRRPDLTNEKFVIDPFAAASYRNMKPSDSNSLDTIELNASSPSSSPSSSALSSVLTFDASNNKRIAFEQFTSDNVIKMYRTGDLARYRADGNVDYLGRIDHQVKFRGFRIELGEIEHSLTKLDGVEVGAVVAEKDSDNAIKRLVAFYVPECEQKSAVQDNGHDLSGTTNNETCRDLHIKVQDKDSSGYHQSTHRQKVTPNELRSALQKRLPDYMVPALFVEVDKMPLTPNGKIDRRALSIPAGTISFNQKDGVYYGANRQDWIGSRDNIEFQLLRIWEDVLDIKPIGIRDNFFDLGGHSLIAVRLMAQITKEFKKHLPLAALFQGATVEAMAKFLKEQDKTDNETNRGRSNESDIWSSLVPIQPKGNLHPLFCVPGAGGNVVYLHDLAGAVRSTTRDIETMRPFYGLQPPGLNGVTPPHKEVETLAAHYISVIKDVQPHGAYFISGHSFGGLVAFEMAQQLLKQGEEVEALVLIDTPAPRFFEPTGKDWDEARWLTQVAEIASHQYRANLNIDYETLAALSPEEQLSFVHNRLKDCDILPPDAELVHFRGFIDVYKANLRAVYQPFGENSKLSGSTRDLLMPAKFILLRSRDEQPENIASSSMKELRAMLDLGWREYLEQYHSKEFSKSYLTSCETQVISSKNQDSIKNQSPIEVLTESHFDANIKVIEIPGDHLTMLRPPHVFTIADELKKIGVL